MDALSAHLGHGDVLGTCRSAGARTVGTSVTPETAVEGLMVKVLRNPTTSYFTLQISSDKKENIHVRVMDIRGCQQLMQKLPASGQLEFAHQLGSYIYLVEV